MKVGINVSYLRLQPDRLATTSTSPVSFLISLWFFVGVKINGENPKAKTSSYAVCLFFLLYDDNDVRLLIHYGLRVVVTLRLQINAADARVIHWRGTIYKVWLYSLELWHAITKQASNQVFISHYNGRWVVECEWMWAWIPISTRIP